MINPSYKFRIRIELIAETKHIFNYEEVLLVIPHYSLNIKPQETIQMVEPLHERRH